MTWRFKVQGVIVSLVVLGGLAAAAGATWIEALSAGNGWFGTGW